MQKLGRRRNGFRAQWWLCGRKKCIATWRNFKIDTGCIVAFTQTVSYDIQFVGGIKKYHFRWRRFILCTPLQSPGKFGFRRFYQQIGPEF